MTTATSRRVLLVEDEASLVLALTDRLEAEGYLVTAVRDAGRQFLDGGLGGL